MAALTTLRRRQSRQDEKANNATTAPRTDFDGGPSTVVSMMLNTCYMNLSA